jgi:predicted nucleotidyltransferase
MKLNSNIDTAIEELKKSLKERFGVETELFLFGSVARGESSESSDVDILVLLKDTVTTAVEEKIYDIAYEIGLEYDIVFGIIVNTKKEWDKLSNIQSPLVVEIKRKGVKI